MNVTGRPLTGFDCRDTAATSWMESVPSAKAEGRLAISRIATGPAPTPPLPELAPLQASVATTNIAALARIDAPG